MYRPSRGLWYVTLHGVQHKLGPGPEDRIPDEVLRGCHALARQHAPKYCLYNLRHSWLDRALKSGVDALTAAMLMGHRDPSTVAKVYQHVSQSPEYLQAALGKVRRAGA